MKIFHLCRINLIRKKGRLQDKVMDGLKTTTNVSSGFYFFSDLCGGKIVYYCKDDWQLIGGDYNVTHGIIPQGLTVFATIYSVQQIYILCQLLFRLWHEH